MNQSIFYSMALVSFSASLYATEAAPVYKNDLLSIPRVDFPESVGAYENVVFKRAFDGRWDLIRASEVQLAPVERIEIKKTATSPVQVFVKVKGHFRDGCGSIGHVFTRQDGNNFTITVSQKTLQTFQACTQALVPFELTLPLAVYGLSKGSYTVNVNKINQSFQLDADVGEPSTSTTVTQ